MKNHLTPRSCALLACSLLLLLWNPAPRQPAGEAAALPPPEQVESFSAGFLERLSPDLRAAALEGGDEILMVTVVLQPGTNPAAALDRFALSREVGGVQWAVGQVPASRLEKIASLPGVLGVVSPETFQTTEAPGLDELRSAPLRPTAEQARAWLLEGPPTDWPQTPAQWKRSPAAAPAQIPLAADWITRPMQIHGAPAAQALNLRGEGVRVAVIDTGVDFGHPDLQGTQAVLTQGAYAGWPFAYDVISGARYAVEPGYAFNPDNQMVGYGYTRYVHTLPVSAPDCNGSVCTALLIFHLEPVHISIEATWPDNSKSGQYYYSLHPDYLLPYAAFAMGLGYQELSFGSPLVITADRAQSGIYDTVYVDVNYDKNLTSPNEIMTRARPLAGADLNQDGTWDLSAGLLAWISDGQHHPPGVVMLYPKVASSPVPEAGRLLAFVNDEHGHGTNCAGQIAAQGVINDPTGIGPRNPALSGAVIQGMAPKAQIVALENGFELPLDAWTIAALGMDGLPQSGDEAQVISNSWGASSTIDDGWDIFSRFAAELNRVDAPQASFLAATGNGGHGYGTVTSPGGGTILDVGASTFNGESVYFEKVQPQQFLYGDIQPWSNRGPGTQGDIAPDIAAVGAWGLGPNPLNYYYGNGQAAYDVFGGTSMSTPLAAGGMALVYQAYRQAHGVWPTWQQARDLLLTGAEDLGYDALTQGSGNLRVDRSVLAALEEAARVSPTQWTPGSAYAAFPSLLQPGQSAAQSFTLSNPSSSDAFVAVTATHLNAVHVESFQVPYTYPRPSMPSIYPLYLEDLSSWIAAYDPDLVRAEVILPFESFDTNGDYYFEHSWEVFFYEWTDLDGDGKLWDDLNHDDRIGAGELDVDPVTGLSEYNRFTSAYPGSTAVQVELGRSALERFTSHGSGVFLGLDCTFCGASTPLQVRVTFYREEPWDWLTVPASAVPIRAEGTANFQAVLTLPAGSEPGTYQGMIHLSLPGFTQSVPVLVNAAAPTASFQFGASNTAPSLAYENTRLAGGFDWRWRYESGDWRTFYFNVPAGSAGPNTRLVVDTRWNSGYSDVDSWVFGAYKDTYSSTAPDFFGPSGMQSAGGSVDTYFGNGHFRRETNTGYAREVVGAELRDGLGMLVLHNVLSGGDQFSEPLSGSVYQVGVSPSPSDLVAAPISLDPPRLSGTTAFQFLSSGSIPDGLRIQSYGFSPRIVLTAQPIRQDSPSNICSGSWIYGSTSGGLAVHGGLLEVALDAVQPAGMDLDVYIFEDNGSGLFECGRDALRFYSNAAGSQDRVKVAFPLDGDYWVMVHGYYVPLGTGSFGITLRAVGGNEIRLRNLPFGPVQAGSPLTFDADYNAAYDFDTPVTLDGVIFVGLPGVPDLLEIPLTLRPNILLYPAPRLWFDAPSVFDQPVGLSLSMTNLGTLAETVQVTLALPPELAFVSSPPGGVLYEAGTHSLNWSGPLGAAQSALIGAQLTAAPGAYSGPVTVSGQVRGLTSGQIQPVSALILVRQTKSFLPVIRR